MKKLIAIVTATLAISACGGPERGIVFDSKYNQGFTYFTTCGKVMCPVYQPATWNLDIYAPNGEHGWIAVDETTFHKCQKNEQYPLCGMEQAA